MKWIKAKDCESAHCLEVACDSAACVELTQGGAGVLLRASGAPETMVELTREEFRVFLAGAKAGDFDHL